MTSIRSEVILVASAVGPHRVTDKISVNCLIRTMLAGVGIKWADCMLLLRPRNLPGETDLVAVSVYILETRI